MGLNTLLVIQARMGSTRLPGKMLLELGGRPVIDWVVRRCLSAKLPDACVVAMPETAENDALADRCEQLGCDVYRGSEIDVLQRTRNAADLYAPEVVVRVCGDRPLVDPDVIDATIQSFLLSQALPPSSDIFFSHKNAGTQAWPYGFGAEVLKYDLLDRLEKNVTDPVDREHVTLHMYNNPDSYRVTALECPESFSQNEKAGKFDLDSPEDFKRLNDIVSVSDSMITQGNIFIARANIF